MTLMAMRRGKMLRRMGVVFVDHMPWTKVRIKLILALSKTKNLKEVRTCFWRNRLLK